MSLRTSPQTGVTIFQIEIAAMLREIPTPVCAPARNDGDGAERGRDQHRCTAHFVLDAFGNRGIIGKEIHQLLLIAS